MAEKTYSREEWQRWRDHQPRKLMYSTQAGNLVQCKLCGNRHPLTPTYFMQSPRAEPLYSLIREGLVFICLECEKGWGPDFKQDVNRIYRQAQENERAGRRRPLKPMARPNQKGLA